MPSDLEQTLRELFEAGALDDVATSCLKRYGPEILGWLAATSGDRALADDCFSELAEDMWSGLPAFRWECSLRTWLYVLARNARCRIRRSPHIRRERLQSHVSGVAMSIRSQTNPWQQTQIKGRFRALRDELDEQSRSLLILRVDRKMKWDDIARVLGEPGSPGQASARLRKRFSTLKQHLRSRAEAEGLLKSEDR